MDKAKVALNLLNSINALGVARRRLGLVFMSNINNLSKDQVKQLSKKIRECSNYDRKLRCELQVIVNEMV